MNKPVRANFFVSLILFLMATGYGQVTYVGFPIDLQLFPRDLTTGEAGVTVTGVVPQSTGYTRIELEVLRGGVAEGIQSEDLTFSGNQASYSITYSFTAELQNRTFILKGMSGNTSTEITRAERVVAGDVIVIEGQSNAEARQFSGDANINQSEFIRVYGSGHEAGNFPEQWFEGNGNADRNGNGNTGQWGMRLARQIMDDQNVPVAVFNGAHGGRPVEFFERDDTDPTNMGTNYGRLLTRLETTGLAESVIAVFWHQGESNATGNFSTTDAYKNKWMEMYDDWKTDFTALQNIFLFQIRMACGGDNNPEGYMSVQEAHRQIALENEDIFIISTTGADHHTDQCHYPYEIYEKFGDWAWALMAREVYGQTPSENIDPPQIVQVAQNGKQLLIKVINDEGLEGLGDFHTEFRLEGTTGTLAGSDISGGEVVLSMSGSDPVTGISYRSHRGTAAPTIINNTGMGIVAFKDFPVVPYKPGCTDASGSNYDETATHDDGSCLVPVAALFKTVPFAFTQTKNALIISSHKKTGYKVTLKDPLGRTRYTGVAQKELSVPLKSLESGQYFLELIQDQKKWIKVIRVQH